MTTTTSPDDETAVATVTTSQSKTSMSTSSTTRKSETHRVTFVEHNNTEYGPPGHTRLITDYEDSTHQYYSNELTDSGYTDSIAGSTSGDYSHTNGGANGSAVPLLAGSPTSATAPPKPVLRLTRAASQESHDNPFLADGELSKKAETIVRHSTISRTELKIYDPDKEPIAEPAIVNEQVVPAQAGVTNAAPRPDNIGVKQNGNVDDGTAVTPASVEVEVGAGNASAAEPQKAEEVKVEKDPKCKCCVLQ